MLNQNFLEVTSIPRPNLQVSVQIWKGSSRARNFGFAQALALTIVVSLTTAARSTWAESAASDFLQVPANTPLVIDSTDPSAPVTLTREALELKRMPSEDGVSRVGRAADGTLYRLLDQPRPSSRLVDRSRPSNDSLDAGACIATQAQEVAKSSPGTPPLGSAALPLAGPETLGSSAPLTREAALPFDSGASTQAAFQKTELVSAAQEFLRKNSERAERDQTLIDLAFQKQSETSGLEAIQAALIRAHDSLTARVAVLDSARSGLSAGEIARFRAVFLNAADQASIGQDILSKSARSGSQSTSPDSRLFAELLTGPQSQPLLQSIFAPTAHREATTMDSLVERIMKFGALDESTQAALQPQLSLIESPLLNLDNGKTQKITLLHNGYIFGGLGNSTDCSKFISSILPPEIRKGRLTTLDFLALFIYLKSGKLPHPPIYPSDRAKMLIQLSDAFWSVDVAQGETAMPGDLLIFRSIYQTVGHVFLISSYDPKTGIASVIEASQAAGTLRERNYDLTVPTPGGSRRVRPSLFALRLKPETNRACHYEGRAHP